MKRTLLILCFACMVFVASATRTNAQGMLFTNEPVMIRTFGFNGDGPCRPYVQGPINWAKFTWNASTGEVTSQFSKAGTYYDTARFDVSYPSGRCGQSGVQTFTAIAVIHNDSVIRMLPRQLTDTAFADKADSGWTARLSQRINHKIPQTSTLSDWKFEIDSTLGATLEVLKGTDAVTNLSLMPYEAGTTLTYILRFRRGPIYQDRSYKGVLSVRVKNASEDSVYTTPVVIQMVAPRWQPIFGFAVDTLRLTSPDHMVVSASVGLKLDRQTQHYSLRQLEGTISSSAAAISPGDSGNVQIVGQARRSGNYLERLKIIADIVDHNGDLRKDSDEVLIELTVTGEAGPVNWEGTDGAFTAARQLALDDNGTVYASGDKLFSSRDDGHRWEEIHTADTIYALHVTAKGNIVLIGNNHFVRTSTDLGGTWKTEQFGCTIYTGGPHFLMYQNHHIGGAGDAVFAEGSEKYYDYYYQRIEYPQGTYASMDGARTWSNAATGNLDYGVTDVARDSSFNYLVASDRSIRHTATNRVFMFARSVQGIAVDGNGSFFVMSGDGLYVSTDIGYTWQRKSLIFDTVKGFAVAADGEIFVATASAVYHSTDLGMEWETINAGLGSTKITSLTLKAGGKVFVGTIGGGVYRSIADTKLAMPSYVTRRAHADDLIRIIRRGPVRYLKLASSDVRVQITDLLGREIRTNETPDGFSLGDLPVLIRASDGVHQQTIKLWH